MLNKVFLIGNLGRDPEVRTTQGGQPVVSFSLATTRRYKDREGAQQEQTEWHNIVVFGKQAEIAGRYLAKGRRILVEGRLQTRSWEDRESGKKQYRTEIVCENFQMLDSRGPGGGGESGAPAARQEAPSDAGFDAPGPGDARDDDIPF